MDLPSAVQKTQLKSLAITVFLFVNLFLVCAHCSYYQTQIRCSNEQATVTWCWWLFSRCKHFGKTFDHSFAACTPPPPTFEVEISSCALIPLVKSTAAKQQTDLQQPVFNQTRKYITTVYHINRLLAYTDTRSCTQSSRSPVYSTHLHDLSAGHRDWQQKETLKGTRPKNRNEVLRYAAASIAKASGVSFRVPRPRSTRQSRPEDEVCSYSQRCCRSHGFSRSFTSSSCQL